MSTRPHRTFVPFEAGDASDLASPPPAKKPYTTPRLTRLGRLDEGDARRIAFDDAGR